MTSRVRAVGVEFTPLEEDDELNRLADAAAGVEGPFDPERNDTPSPTVGVDVVAPLPVAPPTETLAAGVVPGSAVPLDTVVVTFGRAVDTGSVVVVLGSVVVTGPVVVILGNVVVTCSVVVTGSVVVILGNVVVTCSVVVTGSVVVILGSVVVTGSVVLIGRVAVIGRVVVICVGAAERPTAVPATRPSTTTMQSPAADFTPPRYPFGRSN